jgi:hypothetical protein
MSRLFTVLSNEGMSPIGLQHHLQKYLTNSMGKYHKIWLKRQQEPVLKISEKVIMTTMSSWHEQLAIHLPKKDPKYVFSGPAKAQKCLFSDDGYR